MMKKFAFLVFVICLFTTLASAQKTVRKRTKAPSIQKTATQTSSETNQNSEKTDSSQTNSNQVKSNQVDTPVKILEKPRPQLFPDGQDCSQGKVVLRVTFLDSGEIGRISVISGLTKGKTESSVEAAKKIKFIPAMKDGQTVTVTKPVEYIFTIY